MMPVKIPKVGFKFLRKRIQEEGYQNLA